jgi:hypothetical protein
MYKKIIIAQSIKELKYILKNINDNNLFCLPLNLKTQIYCEVSKIPFINLSQYSNNLLHKKIQSETEKIIKKSNTSFLKLESIKSSYHQWLEYKTVSIIFLYYILEEIKKKNKVERIYTSGWDNFSILDRESYYTTRVVKNICKEIEVESVDKIQNIILDYSKIKQYKILSNIPKNKKNLIFISNLGYNFNKILHWSYKNNYSSVIPIYKKINYLKKIFLYFFNIYVIQIIETKNIKKILRTKLPNIFFKNINLSDCIYQNKLNVMAFFLNLENKALLFKNILKKNSIDLIVSNSSIGLDGSFLEIGKSFKKKTLNIPHGTLTGFFNKGGKVFNKKISNALFSTYAVNALQSKITTNFKKKFKIKDAQCLSTGNLIFNNQDNCVGNNILYAETNKDYFNYRSFGFQTFYEFLNNLNTLDQLAGKIEQKIFVKPHPNEFDAISYLKKKYKNLYFTKEKNNKLFKKIKITISFSSSMIEDSLYSKIPVILYDVHKRYKHCEAEQNIYKKNCAIYYVNNINNLSKCIGTILKSNAVQFNKYVMSGDIGLNFNNTLKNLIFRKIEN